MSYRVATLTFHQVLNYGAVLQAYALQRAIRTLGIDSVLLDYSCSQLKKEQMIIMWPPRKLAGSLVRLGPRLRKKRAFDSFRAHHIALSNPLNRETIADTSKNFARYVVGSDQVWNPDLTNDDTTYFLDFIESTEKKGAYAASIGAEQWGRSGESRFSDLVDGFDYVSVRERVTSDYLFDRLGVRFPVVCDPTLLLNAAEWDRVSDDPRIKEPYVLAYVLGPVGADCLSWCKDVARKLDSIVVVVHDDRFSHRCVVNIRDAGPGEFLGLVRNAKYVVTNSFHGICFSLIYEKDFAWFIGESEPAEISRRRGRIDHLLQRIEAGNRKVSKRSLFPDPIDYRAVNRELEKFRKSSFTELMNAIGIGNQPHGGFPNGER